MSTLLLHGSLLLVFAWLIIGGRSSAAGHRRARSRRAGRYLGSQHIAHVRAGIAKTEHHVLFAAALLALAYVTWRHLHLRSATHPEPEPGP